MSHPLIERLTSEFGWPVLDTEHDIREFGSLPGTHVFFCPGDPKRNLESADVAVILPELKLAFQGKFDCAVVGAGVETALREATGVLKTPSLIFYRDGQFLAGIPKVRNWDDYMNRIAQILAMPTPQPA
ncbi:thioredoxin domain-containing protein [Celeribacter litoreus]|uniref:hydrogenase accessory protein n=1 Tax=Celeribacter litoreus TaxID=2876714 RepID=UPI001CCA21E3|nr:hydrogenase accessory protein [Celeribacter litoreus]MCA0043215.1 hydrogenase accessory protein [Celeribacter litoreus]